MVEIKKNHFFALKSVYLYIESYIYKFCEKYIKNVCLTAIFISKIQIWLKMAKIMISSKNVLKMAKMAQMIVHHSLFGLNLRLVNLGRVPETFGFFPVILH